jgi:hypothetical protein
VHNPPPIRQLVRIDHEIEGKPVSGSGDSRWIAITGVGTVILVLIGTVTYFQVKSGNSNPSAIASSSTTSAAGPATTATTTSASGHSVSAPTSAPASSFSYVTGDPFPLCDTKRAQWTLSGMTSEAGGCAASGTQITTVDGTYGYDTASSFPGLSALPQNSTVTVAGTLPDSADGYHSRCLGVAEGNSSTGYFAYICNSGNWHIVQVTGLGSGDVAFTPNPVASGQYPFGASDSYTVSLAFSGTRLTLTVSIVGSTASPLRQSVRINEFTPTAVGIGSGTGDSVIPLDPAGFYVSISYFSYRTSG